MENSIENKTALIIGGSGGLGKEIALTLAKENVNLIVQGRNLEKLKNLEHQFEKIQSIKSNQPKNSITLFHQNFTKNENNITSLNLCVNSADILIVCYGPFLQKELHNTTYEEWESIVYWNYTFPGQLISSALPSMMKKGFGRILVFGGTRTYSINGYRTNAAYGGAKTALCSLVKSVAAEYGKYGITCNAILPGFMETEYLSEPTKEILAAKMPRGKLIPEKNIGEAASFLLKNSSLNGVLLNIDEGWMP